MDVVTLDSMPDTELSGAIGYFDGVHLGHAAVLSAAAEAAAAAGRKSAAITFDLTKFRPGGKGGEDLMTREHCFRQIAALGLDYTVVIPMDRVWDETPEEFSGQVLGKRLRVKTLFCGEDFRYGKERNGTAGLLQSDGTRFGFDVGIVPGVEIGGVPVSTSRIKELIAAGEVSEAARLLGRNYSYSGVVIEDKHLARELGFPTANQHFPKIVRPQHGVYVSETEIGGIKYRSVTNLGTRPTTGGGEYISETHVIGFDGDLVGTELTVELLEYRRPEIRFRDVSELKKAVLEDIEAAVSYIGS